MVTNCKNCGLPIFHGIAGYAGPQCMCKLVTLPQMFDESMARIVALEAERDTLRKQLDEARELLMTSKCGINIQDTEWQFNPSEMKGLRESIDAWLEANK